MRDRYQILDQEGVHFVTSTVVEWLPVFTRESYFQIIIDTFKYCIDKQGLQIFAYVILDNHFHLIAQAPDLVKTMTSIRQHTAHEIIQKLKDDRKDWLLNQLSYYKMRHKNKSKHQIWQEGMHPEMISGTDMLFQKIEYIHLNPVKRGYVTEQAHWKYSSARNYLLNDHSVIDVVCSLR